jgi:hypothetical protein
MSLENDIQTIRESLKETVLLNEKEVFEDEKNHSTLTDIQAQIVNKINAVIHPNERADIIAACQHIIEDLSESKVNETSRYEVIITGLNDNDNMKDYRETTAISEIQAVANIISRLAKSTKDLKYEGIEVSPQNIGLLVSKIKAKVNKLN